MTRGSSRRDIGIAVIAVLALTALSLTAIALGRSGRGRVDRFDSSVTTSSAVPTLAGSVVGVTLSNMGGPMMGSGSRPTGGTMRLRADEATVAHGTVSFLAVNIGSVNHELVVLPLPGDQIVGTRSPGGDGQIDETGKLAEASTTCGAGPGGGIAPGRSSWITVTLSAGRYELVCNLPGHYAAGMYTQLTVT